MAQKFNTEFNYRYQVIGCTPWEKIKTLKGFLEGRVRAAALEEVGNLKHQAKLSKLKHLQNSGNGLEHEILELRAEIMELDSHQVTLEEAFELTKDEIKILKKLLKELYVMAEPTRIKGYTDEQMFEANAANEFTVDIGREIQAEMIANGRPSAAKLRNAMSNPHTWNALKQIGLIPKKTKILEGNINPQLKIELKGVEDEEV
jgi:predicted nuclease with TOPRIM domain